MRLRWLGHATVLIELQGTRLLTDPLLLRRMAHLWRRAPVPEGAGTLDAVLISHVHDDHLHLPSLAALSGGPPIVAPAGAGELLRSKGFEQVVELQSGGMTTVKDVRVTATHAEHPARRRPWSPWVPSLGYLLEADARVYFAGDTDVFEGMADLAPLDVALLPVWGWGPSLGPGHLNPRTAAEAVRLLHPRVAVPIHWGTFSPIGRRGPAKHPPREFARHVAKLAPEVEVRILEPGSDAEDL